MLPALDRPSPSPSQSSSPLVPTNESQGVCINCNSQPQARDLTTGYYYPFCSNSCAAPDTLPTLPTGPGGLNASMNANTVSEMCNHCKIRRRYTEGFTEYPYCSRTCAKLAKINQPVNGNAPVFNGCANHPSVTKITTRQNRRLSLPTSLNAPVFNGRANFVTTVPTRQNRRLPTSLMADLGTSFNVRLGPVTPTDMDATSGNRSTPSGQTCQTPGCTNLAYFNQAGVASKYCSKAHMRLGESGCIYCRNAPLMEDSFTFCQHCYDEVLRLAPMIVEVPQDHGRYKNVTKEFWTKWSQMGEIPEVRAIYKIVSPRANAAKYDQYLNQVEAEGNFSAQGRRRGNQNRRWYGTTRECNIGDEGVTKFCSSPSCSLCCIMKASFDIAFFAKRKNFGKFGTGIYTSSTSSKSDCYSRNDCASEWKAMLLNKVVVGRGYKKKSENTTLTAPPVGCHSVSACAGAGSSLNSDELVVYNNDAIRPSYLVMYESL